MGYVYGNLRVYVTGMSEELEQVPGVLRACENGGEYKDWFLKDWERSVKNPRKATYGRQTVVIDHFWDNATSIAKLLIELGQKMPALELKIVCRTAYSVTDVYTRYTVEKDRDKTGWYSSTWSVRTDTAGFLLGVELPK